MGTSQSSSGPGAGVPLVPPWADDVDPPEPPDGDSPPEGEDAPKPDPLAPRARFRDARRGLGRFVRSGDSRYLRRTLGHYVRTGYGGSATMSRRVGGTAATAGRLNGVLQSGRAPDGSALRDAALASGNDVNVVLDAIVEAASPADGTQDRSLPGTQFVTPSPTSWPVSLMLICSRSPTRNESSSSSDTRRSTSTADSVWTSRRPSWRRRPTRRQP